MKSQFIVIVMYMFAFGVFLCPASHGYAQEANAKIEYKSWANVLNAYVDDNGLVDYQGLLKNRGELDQFIKQVRTYDVSQLRGNDLKAFWINSYNAVTLEVVLAKYPVKSIRHINFGLVWEVPRKVAGQKLSLGHMEHQILRPLGDPRIHFAINCASIGCPKLPNKPFYPETLDQQLDSEAKRFINDLEKVRLDRNTNMLYHSAILVWFEDDFLVVKESLLEYIKLYINEEDRAYLNSHKVELKQTKYDWNLNKQ